MNEENFPTEILAKLDRIIELLECLPVTDDNDLLKVRVVETR